MENKRTPSHLIATDSPRPGDFPIGSEMSRAAARALLESRATDDETGITIIVRSVLLSQDTSDKCLEILDECGFLPRTAMRVVDLCSIPQGMTGPDLESYVRQHAAEICGPHREAA